MTHISRLTVPGPAGSLQAVVEHPDGPARAVAVVCHPHSLHGGTLHNKVVHQLVRSFRQLGAVGVRFNFRGVGASEGAYDAGRGEQDDLLAVVDWARQRWPGLPLWLGGFSFGGIIALRGADRLDPAWLVTVAPAVTHFAAPEPRGDYPWLLILGDADDVVMSGRVLDWLSGLQRQPRLVVFEGGGHFFHRRLNDLMQAVIQAAPAD
jgi:alpha/beta superfamily hydrolase